MSTSLLYHAFGIRGYEYVRTDYQDGATLFTIRQDPETCRCSACGSRQVISRGHAERQFLALPIGRRKTTVALPIPRVECQACGRVRQVEVPFADPRRSYTKSFERYVLELSRRMTIKDVAHHLDIGWDMVKDIQKRDLSRRYAKPKLKHLRAIAIDEIAVARGHRYLTVVMDLESGAVVFVGDGKGADALKPFWKRVRPSGAKIAAVAMDMSGAYQAAVRVNLPKAVIVFDRFHVVKLFNDKLSDLRRALVPRGDRRAAQGGAQGDAVAAAEERREPRPGEGREEAAAGGAEAERAAGCGLLPEGGPAAVLGAAGEALRHDVPRRMDSPGGGVGDPDPPADGQDAGGAPIGPAGVLRRDDLERPDGGDEQQDQDDEAAGVWVPGPRVLQAEDPGDP